MASGVPVVGWRLWRLCDERLCSWVVQQAWEPGVNVAGCLTNGYRVSLFNSTRGRCMRSPGTDCGCGLWALWDFGVCARKARQESAPSDRDNIVIGLVAGWGTIAIHGDEGFRSQYAAVRCLFTDAVAGRSHTARAVGPGRWTEVVRGLSGREPGDARTASIRRTAELYGVPLLSLAGAVRMGVLAELGVSPERIRTMAAELAAH